MFVCLGRKVTLVLTNGREVSSTARSGLLHDESGKDWPKCSLLITSFEQGSEKVDNKRARNYFGKNTPAYKGSVDVPPKDLSRWKRVGEVKEIFYDRVGKHDGYFKHRFHSPRGLWKLLFLAKPKGKPVTLYQLGKSYRLELPDNCLLDDRGLIFP